MEGPYHETPKERIDWVYQGSRKGKAGRFATPYDSPYVEPEEPMSSEGLGVCSFLLHEEEEAIKAVSDGKWTNQGSKEHREGKQRKQIDCKEEDKLGIKGSRK